MLDWYGHSRRLVGRSGTAADLNYSLSRPSAKFPPHLHPLILSSLFPPPLPQTMTVLRFVNLSQSSSLALAMLITECAADKTFVLQLATAGMGP